MSAPPLAGRAGRETRLLLATIAISVGVLLLLARFRFPENADHRPAEAAPAPLERLAAQATYEELASIMADLERRITPRVWVMRADGDGMTGSLVIAPRITPDRAVVLMEPDDRLESATQGTEVEIVARDVVRGVAVVRVPAVDDGAVPIRTGPPRPGPRYVAVVEGTPQGPALRPVYVGRMALVPDPRTGTQQLELTALQHAIPRGAAIFTLEGAFVGLVRDSGQGATVLTSEFLRTAADGAQPVSNQPMATLGIEVDALTPSLARATGADRGVVVTHVAPLGPAVKVLQPGDVIQAIDGTPVSSVTGLRQHETSRAPGASVAVTGVRRGTPLQATIVAGDAGATPAAAPEEGAGFVGRNVPGTGVEVMTVSKGGAAAAAGLEPGDLIVAIDGQQDPDTAGITRRYRTTAAGQALLLTVRRGQRHHVLALEKR